MSKRKQLQLLTLLFSFLAALASSASQGLSTSPLSIANIFNTSTSATSFFAVLHIVDGDTLDIDKGGEKIRIRLIGINSPESVDPRRPVQCFGKEASRYATSILQGNQVSIELDPSQGEFDKYKRTLAYVFLPDGRSFNQLMISEGYAYEYTYRLPYKYQKDFKDAENDARSHQRGLWASATCSLESGTQQK